MVILSRFAIYYGNVRLESMTRVLDCIKRIQNERKQ